MTIFLRRWLQRSDEPSEGDEKRSTRATFFLLFFIPLLITVAYGGTDTWGLILVAPVVTLLGLIWIVRSIRQNVFEIEMHPTLLVLAGILVFSLMQLLPFGSVAGSEQLLTSGVAPSSAISFDPFATRLFAVRIFFYVIFFAAALTYIDTAERLRQTLVAVAVIGGVVAFGGILQKLASPDAIYGLRETPHAIPFGPFVNQHHFAALMVLLSGPVLAEVLDRKATLERKGFFAIAAILMAAAVLLTGSRGGFVAYISMASVVAVLQLRGAQGARSRGKYTALAVGATGGVIVLGLVVMLGGAESIFRSIGFQNTADDISSGRVHFWAGALKIFVSHPVLGTGMDAFGVAYTAFDPNNGLYRVEQAHNEYLQALADGGIVGLALVLLFIWFLVRAGFRRIAEAKNPTTCSIRIGALAGCTGILIHSFFDFPLRTAANAFFFLLIAAVAIVPISIGEDKTTLSNLD